MVEFDVYPAPAGNWVAHGIVEDESVETCTVNLGGTIGTFTVTLDSEGEFYFILNLTEDNRGIATCQAVNSAGRTSNVLESYVAV